jgi:YidC/Oxa1 family membrane protein insertase
MLRWFHDLVGSWGVAIILLTIVVKTFLWWPQMKAQKSMKRMSKLSPMMKEIQEKYKDDQARQSQEMMKLYKDYGVNPVGGCLPMLIQMPIFFGLLGILQVCAELRGQSFLWVKDLSLPDTIAHIPLLGWALNPLPILMGLTQVVMMKVMPQPATVDKMQQRMMTFMPFIFVFICYSFASALALYYTVQNLYSLIQTIVMQRMNKDDDAPLVKVKRVAPAATSGNRMFGSGMPEQPKKDKKPGLPQLGGGSTGSRGKK